jgi:hypothetical protein
VVSLCLQQKKLFQSGCIAKYVEGTLPCKTSSCSGGVSLVGLRCILLLFICCCCCCLLLLQGFSCALAGLWGTSSGTTAYNENIGAMQITRVGSVRVVQLGAVCAIIMALIGEH